ncbi:MAG: 1-(5-phosphoribosyl)-5-amino-4-imidazole-carboxylate carboxylase, partial [Candidatus Hydrogenedentes bacterium]|nr:1-(5-phosphoribosyl)-5-amino-4-imidazole-carboxylate carboxylase [Candidatus Hydrogenedentota bacterium]
MDPSKLTALLELVAAGAMSAEDAAARLRGLPFEDLEFAKVDHHRSLRKGYAETIFCAGKTT